MPPPSAIPLLAPGLAAAPRRARTPNVLPQAADRRRAALCSQLPLPRALPLWRLNRGRSFGFHATAAGVNLAHQAPQATATLGPAPRPLPALSGASPVLARSVPWVIGSARHRVGEPASRHALAGSCWACAAEPILGGFTRPLQVFPARHQANGRPIGAGRRG